MTQKYLKKLLSYNPSTGIFTWKIRRRKIRIGNVAGGINDNGYIRIKIDYKLHRAHRLAWLYIYGYLPNEMDHINHNRTDNRIENLREVTREENCKNRSIMLNNTSGITGVYWRKDRKKWQADIGFNGKQIFLGLFTDINEAKEVRKQAKIKYNFHPNHA